MDHYSLVCPHSDPSTVTVGPAILESVREEQRNIAA
jgi:hypothetical protein